MMLDKYLKKLDSANLEHKHHRKSAQAAAGDAMKHINRTVTKVQDKEAKSTGQQDREKCERGGEGMLLSNQDKSLRTWLQGHSRRK